MVFTRPQVAQLVYAGVARLVYDSCVASARGLRGSPFAVCFADVIVQALARPTDPLAVVRPSCLSLTAPSAAPAEDAAHVPGGGCTHAAN